jgi:hypothetical protein
MEQSEPKELLLRVVMRLVEKELNGQGLRTFAAVLVKGPEIQVLVPETMKKNVTTDELHEYWIGELRSSVSSRHSEVVCYCTDLRVTDENGTLVTPGVLVFVEESGGSAEYRFYTYEKKKDSAVAMHEPTIEAIPTRVFTM